MGPGPGTWMTFAEWFRDRLSLRNTGLSHMPRPPPPAFTAAGSSQRLAGEVPAAAGSEVGTSPGTAEVVEACSNGWCKDLTILWGFRAYGGILHTFCFFSGLSDEVFIEGYHGL